MSMHDGRITVAIPSHPARVTNGMLSRSLDSVHRQDHPAAAVALALDHQRAGAAVTRQLALDMVRTEWVAFLDSDDEFMPHHLGTLMRGAEESGADYVFGWFTCVGGSDPFPQHFGKVWDSVNVRQTTMTVLVRTELAQEVGFMAAPGGAEIGGQRWGEDYTFTLGCNERGKIHHVPERTWFYHHHGKNSSGQSGRGDAR